MLFLFRNPPGFSLSQAPPTSTQRALSTGVPSITPSGKHTFPPAPNPSPPTTALTSSPSFISLSFALTLSPQSPCSTPSAPSPSRSLCLTKVTSDRTEPLSQLTGVPPMSPHQGGPGKPGALLWLWLLDVESWPMLPSELLRSPPSLTPPTVFHTLFLPPIDHCIPHLLAGDFNTHSPTWSPSHTKTSPWHDTLELWFDQEGFVSMVPKGTITWQHPHHRGSLLDLLLLNEAALAIPAFPCTCAMSFT